LLENWKCILACTLVSMSPFQYGIDFGAIGGLQAMKGFLEVSIIITNQHTFAKNLL
jgi:SP family sugar:H+ symporter-like MFS transporter